MTDNILPSEITDVKPEDLVEVVAGGKKNVIMDSQVLTSLMTCPRATDLRFNLQLQSIKGKSNSLECGSILHTFLEYYYKNIVKGLDRQKAIAFGMTAAELYIRGCSDCTDFRPFETPGENGEMVLVTKPVCGHKVGDFPGVKNTQPDSEGNKTGWKWVLKTCEQYAEFYKNDHWVPLEVEVVKGKILYEDDDLRVMWKAKLDLTADTNQGIFPIDHKSMKQNRPTSSLNNQFIGQCHIMNTRNMIINKVGLQTTLKPEERFIRSVVPYSAPRLMEWVSDTLPFYARLLLMYAESGYYPPNYSNCEGKYGPCPFKGVCESDPGMREEELKLNFVVGPEWNPTNEDE